MMLGFLNFLMLCLFAANTLFAIDSLFHGEYLWGIAHTLVAAVLLVRLLESER